MLRLLAKKTCENIVLPIRNEAVQQKRNLGANSHLNSSWWNNFVKRFAVNQQMKKSFQILEKLHLKVLRLSAVWNHELFKFLDKRVYQRNER